MRDKFVVTATKLGAWDISSPKRPFGSEPLSRADSQRGAVSMQPGCEPPPSSEVKNEWSCTSTPFYAIIACARHYFNPLTISRRRDFFLAFAASSCRNAPRSSDSSVSSLARTREPSNDFSWKFGTKMLWDIPILITIGQGTSCFTRGPTFFS